MLRSADPVSRIYLDHNATTPLLPEAADRMDRVAREVWDNASSVHHFGQQAKAVLDDARGDVAMLLGVDPSEVGLAGLKDRQGVTTQFMSVEGGRPVQWKSADLRIETAGFAAGPLTSDRSVGNAFEVTLRRAMEFYLVKRELSGLMGSKLHAMANVIYSSRLAAFALAPLAAGLPAKHVAEAVASFVRIGAFGSAAGGRTGTMEAGV